jgi:hypothetical protein
LPDGETAEPVHKEIRVGVIAPEDTCPDQGVNLKLLRTTRAALWLIEKYQEIVFLTRDNQFNDDDTAEIQDSLIELYCHICGVTRNQALSHFNSMRKIG